MSLSGFLISRSITKEDTGVDPKWNGDMASRYRSFNSWDDAKKKSIYIFGPNTDPATDKLIRYGLTATSSGRAGD